MKSIRKPLITESSVKKALATLAPLQTNRDIDGDGRPDPMVSSSSAYDYKGLINIFTNCD